MGELKARRDYIPMTRSDLVELLCEDGAFADLDREHFLKLCDLVSAAHHHRLNRRLQDLKRSYDPFDPDTDNTTLMRLTDRQKQDRLNMLYRQFAWLLDHAHFQHLSREEIEPVLLKASHWGVRMDVDFNAFEYVAIFARGEALQRRTRRSLRNFYQEEEAEVPIYRRLVLILKLRRHSRLRGPIDTENVHLKIFKDIPKLDIMMLLPGARVRLTTWDRGKIGLPLLSALGLAVWRFFEDLSRTIWDIISSPNPMWLTAAATGVGYGYKSWYGYYQTRQSYHLTLTRSLYFQNLDSNGGVVTRLLDEAEEQESRVVILAYFLLRQEAGPAGWTGEELDLAMDLYLDRRADIDFDCTGLNALAALRELGLIEECGGGRVRALPLPQAAQHLQASWHRLIEPLAGCKRTHP
jgi:hypothetical protein